MEMKHKKMWLIVVLVCFLVTLLPVNAFATTRDSYKVNLQTNLDGASLMVSVNDDSSVNGSMINGINANTEIRLIITADEGRAFTTPSAIRITNTSGELLFEQKTTLDSETKCTALITGIDRDVNIIITGTSYCFSATIQNKIENAAVYFTIAEGVQGVISGNELTQISPSAKYGDYKITIKADEGKIFSTAPYVKVFPSNGAAHTGHGAVKKITDSEYECLFSGEFLFAGGDHFVRIEVTGSTQNIDDTNFVATILDKTSGATLNVEIIGSGTIESNSIKNITADTTMKFTIEALTGRYFTTEPAITFKVDDILKNIADVEKINDTTYCCNVTGITSDITIEIRANGVEAGKATVINDVVGATVLVTSEDENVAINGNIITGLIPSSFLTVKIIADEGHIFVTPPKVKVTPTNVNQYPQHGYTAAKVSDTEYVCRIAGINYVSDNAKIFVTGVTQDLNDTVHDVMIQNNVLNSDTFIFLNGEGTVSDNIVSAITNDSEIKVTVKALDEKVFFESPMMTVMVDDFKLESVSAEKISDREYVFSIKNIQCDVKLIISGNTTIMKATMQNKMDSGIAQFTVVKGNATVAGNEITGLIPSGEYIISLKAEDGRVFKKIPYVKIASKDGSSTYHGSVYKINDSEYECRFKGSWLPSTDVVITITGDTILKSTIIIVSEANGIYADNLLDNMDIVNEESEIDWSKEVLLELVANELSKTDWSDYESYDAYFETLLEKEIEYYHAYDIHVNLKNGNKSWKIQPKDGGKISIWIPIKDKVFDQNMHLMHVRDDGSFEEIDFAYEKRDGKHGIRFETNHFSKFVLVTDNVVENLGGSGNNDSLGSSNISLGEGIVSTKSIEVSTYDESINVNTKQVDNAVWGVAISALEGDENAKVIISADSSVNIFAVDTNGKEVTSFAQPVIVKIPIGADVLKIAKNKNNLTLALVTTDLQGNTKLEYVGGRYDFKADSFCAYVYKAGDYVLVEDVDLVQVVMTIGDKTVWHNEKGKIELDVPPVINPATNRTELPLSYLGAALGFDILWDGDNRIVSIVKGETNFALKIDEEIPGYGTPYIDVESSRTMVSASYISGMLGANVIWNPDIQEVVVVK